MSYDKLISYDKLLELAPHESRLDAFYAREIFIHLQRAHELAQESDVARGEAARQAEERRALLLDAVRARVAIGPDEDLELVMAPNPGAGPGQRVAGARVVKKKSDDKAASTSDPPPASSETKPPKGEVS